MADPQDLRGAIAVEAVEWAPGGDGKLTIIVRGRWRRRRPVLSGQPVLVIEAEGRRHRFPATPEPPSLGGAPPGGWQMTFTIPIWLEPHLGERAWLQLGLAVMPLTGAVGPPHRSADPKTLTERRARTAELAEERARARVSEAEAVVAELTIRVEELDRSLERAREEPARLRKLIAERDQQRRAAEQRAHAEYAMRLELEEALAEATQGDDQERRIRAGELAAAEDRVRELEQEVEQLRRHVDEAERLVVAARSVPERSVAAVPAALAQPVFAPAASVRFDLERELAIALAGGASGPTMIPIELGAPGLAELRALREERALVAQRSASPTASAGDSAAADEESIMRLHDTVAALREELGARAAREARATARLALAERQAKASGEDRNADDRHADDLTAVLAELRGELEQLSLAAAREASARSLTEERVRELERRIGELEDELRDRDARAERAFETIGELRGLLARLAGGDLEPVFAEPEIEPEIPQASDADPERDPGIELERFDAALARLRAEAGEPNFDDLHPPGERESPMPDGPSIAEEAGDATRPWLREAFVMLVGREPATAGELLVGLLPAQGAVRAEAIAYDIVLAPEDVVRVTNAGGGAPTELERTSSARDLGQVAARISGETAELARLMIAGPFRRRILRRGLARVQGDRAALAAPAAILDTRLDLAQLQAAGVRLHPRLALALIASMVRPSWTIGERFSIAHQPRGPGSATYLHVRNGDPLAITDDPPLGPVATTVSSPAEELLAVLAGGTDVDANVSGDPTPLLALIGWIERAQRG
jgi:hypothetical protein